MSTTAVLFIFLGLLIIHLTRAGKFQQAIGVIFGDTATETGAKDEKKEEQKESFAAMRTRMGARGYPIF